MPLVGPGGRSAPIPRPAAPPRPPPPPRAAGAPPSHTDVTSSGGRYGLAQANAYKATPAYHHAVAQVFKAQPPVQQAKIVQGLVRNNAYRSPEFQAIHQAFASLPAAAKGTIASYAPRETSTFISAGKFTPPERLDFGKTLGSAGLGALRTLVGSLPGSGGVGDVRSYGGALSPQGILSAAGKVSQATAAGASGLRQLGKEVPGGGNQLATVGSGQVGDKFVKNVASDAANVLGAPLTTTALVAKDIGHPGRLVSDLTAQPKEMILHPWQALRDHPLITALVAQGAAAAAARAAAAPIRAFAPEGSALGRAVSTKREGVWLTGKLTHERPPYSKSPYVKAQQVGAEKAVYSRNAQGQLVPSTSFLHSRLLNSEVGQLAGVSNRVRVAALEELKAQHAKAVAPGKIAKAGHGAKTALVYGPNAARVPGANVLERIADTTIRRPDTYTQDLLTHREQVASNRPNLEGRDLTKHDAYVKLLTKEINANRSPKELKRAFAAVAQDHPRYTGLEQQAHGLGHFGGDMTAAGLQRRTLFHFAVTHMGAKMDPELGLVDAQGKPLPTQRILDEINHPVRGTGGRMPTFTSDKVLFSDAQKRSAFYKGERRVRPETKSNKLYSYTHGLSNPTDEGMLLRNAELTTAVHSHRAQNTYADQLANQLPGGGYGRTYSQAERAGAPYGLVPINVAQQFHPQASLDKALEGVEPLAAEEHAARYGLDLSERMRQPESDRPGQGRWALIDPRAADALREHQASISPSTLVRSIRGLNTQFRTVALSLSPRHVPGVAFENLIRDISNGVGFRSWLTGHRAASELQKTSEGKAVRTHLTGGQAAGMTEAGRVYHVSDHWQGTSAYPFLKGWEGMAKAPGLRQARTLWRGYTKLVIGGTKKFLEEQHQIAGLGKGLLREHGYAEAAKAEGFVGLFHRALGLHGKLFEDAVSGLHDPAKVRQMRALINQMYGKWTDLSPHAQTALMFSPFGLWWANSVKFLARMPIDQPVKTGLLASATASTQQRRQQLGMDILGPNALPGYKIGGIPVGGKVIAQNYYSPFGTVNDPIATGSSLIQPWASVPVVLGPLGLNWLGRPLSSPANPHGKKGGASGDQRIQYILDSVLSSFVPLYLKAKQVASGGASPFDVSDSGISPHPLNPPTKQPGGGPVEGLKKAVTPFRSYSLTTGGGSGGASVPGFGSAGGGVSVPGFGSGGNGVAVPGFP